MLVERFYCILAHVQVGSGPGSQTPRGGRLLAGKRRDKIGSNFFATSQRSAAADCLAHHLYCTISAAGMMAGWQGAGGGRPGGEPATPTAMAAPGLRAGRRGMALDGVAVVCAAGAFWYLRVRADHSRSPNPFEERRKHLQEGAAVAGHGDGEVPPMALSPSTLRLTQVQVVFRHGARLPVKARPKGLPEAPSIEWTEADVRPPRELQLVPIQLQSYTGEALEGGIDHERIHAGGETLPGGARSGELSTVGWRQTVALGQRLGARYLGPDAMLACEQGGEGVTPTAAAMLVRSTPFRRTVQSAQGVLTGLLMGGGGGGGQQQQQQQQQGPGGPEHVPQEPWQPVPVRLNRGPQWMVHSQSACPALRRFFKAGLRDPAALAVAAAGAASVAPCNLLF
jgi:hypothetical protein